MNLRTIALALLLLPACAPKPAASAPATVVPNAAAATPDEQPTRTTDAAVPIADAFGIDRIESACRAIEIHASNAARTRVLDIDVDALKLGLRAGTHRFRLDRAAPELRVEVVDYAGARKGESDCTDAGTPDQPARSRAWPAIAGELVLTLSGDASDTELFEVDVELVDVVFRGADGSTKRVAGRFDDIRVGWLPG